jgi:hypothetical protein
MRTVSTILISLFLILPCASKAIGTDSSLLVKSSSDTPEIMAIKNIQRTAKYGSKLISKIDNALSHNKSSIDRLDNEFSQYLLKQKDHFSVLSHDNDTNSYGFIKGKYVTSDMKFGPIHNTESSKTGDSIKYYDISGMCDSALKTKQSERLSSLKSDVTYKIKLHIALKEYEFQLSLINKSKFDRGYRSKLFEAYVTYFPSI